MPCNCPAKNHRVRDAGAGTTGLQSRMLARARLPRFGSIATSQEIYARRSLPPAAHEAAGRGAGGPRLKTGVPAMRVASYPLAHCTRLAAGGEVVRDLGRMDAQPVAKAIRLMSARLPGCSRPRSWKPKKSAAGLALDEPQEGIVVGCSDGRAGVWDGHGEGSRTTSV